MKGDLIRRRAIIAIYQGRLREAVIDAQAALRMTAGVERARALEALGIALYNRGEYRAATRELERCLAATSPDDNRYSNAIHNYTTALAKGTDEEARKALKLCDELHPHLKDRHKMQRAKLWWTRGLIHKRLGNRREAWQALDIARRSLVALKAAPELAAIVGDMAEVSPEPPAVRLICGEAAEVITAGHALTGPLRALAAAAREMIPEAAAALKQAASRLAPCPAL